MDWKIIMLMGAFTAVIILLYRVKIW